MLVSVGRMGKGSKAAFDPSAHNSLGSHQGGTLDRLRSASVQLEIQFPVVGRAGNALDLTRSVPERERDGDGRKAQASQPSSRDRCRATIAIVPARARAVREKRTRWEGVAGL